jgi:hypothetical protein
VFWRKEKEDFISAVINLVESLGLPDILKLECDARRKRGIIS